MESGMRHFGTKVLHRDVHCDLDAARLEQMRPNLVNAELHGARFASLKAHQVRNVQVSALLVAGPSNRAWFHRLTQRRAERPPHADRIQMPGGSHLLHEANAAAYNAALQSFQATQRQAICRSHVSWPRSSAC
jgi:pimeloyl-ACP methyl ester carboxylesterase